MKREKITQALAYGLVLLLGACIYANTARTEFVLDDFHFIVENPIFHHGGGSSTLFHRAMVTEGGAFFRPVAVYTLLLEHSLFGMSAVAFHLGSVFYHLVVTLLLMILVRHFASLPVTVIAGLLFVSHPVHTEAVVALANRPELIATIFFLLVLILFVRVKPSWSRFILANLAHLLGLLSKESAFTLPLVVFVLYWWCKREEKPWRAALSLAPATMIYLLLRQHALGALTYDASVGYFRNEALIERLLTVVKVVPVYARLLFYPMVLSADYSRHTFTNASGFEPAVRTGFLLLLLLALFIAVGLKKRLTVSKTEQPAARPWKKTDAAVQLGFALSLFCITFLPYIHLTPIGYLVAERYLYLPSVGMAWAAAIGLMQLATWIRSRALVYTVVFGMLVWLSFRTATRNFDWTDPLFLWQSTVAAVPQSGFAHANLGLSAYWAGQTSRAAVELERAIALTPERAPFYLALAEVHHRMGNHAEEVATLVRMRAVFGPLPQLVPRLSKAVAELAEPVAPLAKP